MPADQRLTKVYSDQNYKFTTLVRHQGVVIAFAMDDRRRIYYAVLDLRESQADDTRTDADFWTQDPRRLCFPAEITDVGYAAAGNGLLPTVALGGRVETSPATLFPEEIDPFLSTTARLSADCPFFVYSDGAHVFLFRQAVGADHPDAVFRRQSGALSGDRARADLLRDAAGALVPVANASLLCDRFLLISGQLQPAAEVRFRRSRHKTLPDSSKDTLGPEDMDGNAFQEPTQHLPLVRNLKDGQLCVLQVPTGMPDVRRWQLFARNSRTDRFDCFNIERDADGLFNTQGTQAYTSPDPQYQESVYEREPGLCPFTQRELIPIPSAPDLADVGLLFDGAASVTIPDGAGTSFAGGPFTIEAWLRVDKIGPGDAPLLTKAGADPAGGFALSIDAQGRLSARGKSAAITTAAALPLQTWLHVAVSYDGAQLGFLVNGEPSGAANVPALAAAGTPLRLGGGFVGMIDELRLWGRARGVDELRRDRGISLVGQEPGLVGYYRCDEGSGAVLYDQTDNARNGALKGATFAASDAPVSDHPGVRRDSFRFTGRLPVSPPSAVLYHQQERSGPENALLKRQARVLFTCALTGPDGAPSDRQNIAVLDFAVARDGALAQVPDEVGLDLIDTTVQSVKLDEISALQAEITRLKSEAVQAALRPSALYFNGGSGLSMGRALPLANTDFTVEFWLKRKRINHEDYVFHNYSSYFGVLGDRVFAGFSSYNQFRFGFAGSDVASPAYLDTDWHHYACTFNRTTLQRVIYRDGVQVAADVVKAGPTFLMPSSALEVGAYVSAVEKAFVLLDELRCWTQARTPEAIRADMNRRLKGNEAALLAYYTFADRDLRDHSGHGYDLAVKSGDPTVDASILNNTNLVDTSKIEILESQLATMTGGMLGGDVAVPMPLLCTDRSGLSIRGGLLGFAYTSHRPLLLDSVTGDVNLYFRGQNGLFYAAYYDTIVSRHTMALSAGAQPLRLVSRSAGLDLGKATVTVTAGATADLCTVQIKAPRQTETWPDVPRHPQRFADVLNGQALTTDKGGARYDYRRATTTVTGADLSGGSLLFAAVPQEASGAVDNGEGLTTSVAATTRFWADAPGRAFDFNGQQQHLTLPAAQLGDVEVAGPATIEAWINATGVKPRARFLHASTPGSQYTVGLEAAATPDALSLNGTTDSVSLGTRLRLDDCDFTIEFWLKRQQINRDDYVLQLGAPAANQCLFVGFDLRNTIRFGFWGSDMTGPAYTDTDWHHYAFTFNRATRQRVIYRDGVQVASDTAPALFAGQGELVLGPRPARDLPCVLVDEVRLWSRVRSVDEIKGEMNRRVRGNEAALLAYYNFAGRDLRDRTGHGYDGTVKAGDPTTATSVLPSRSYVVFAGVGSSYVRTRDVVYGDGWTHVAVSFNQSWALKFNGATHFVNAGTEDTLNLGGELTIEVFLRVDSLQRAGGVLSKGRLASGTRQRVPYQLTIGTDGKLVFSFESRSGLLTTLTATEALATGVFYRVAAVRRDCRQITSGAMESWQELSLYINGRKVGSVRYDGDEVGANDGPLEIGRACNGRQELYFAGLISEVRLWSAAREARDIGGPLTSRRRDLIAHYNIEENSGNITRDIAGGREARIYGAAWAKNPDPNGSDLHVFLNGVTVPTNPVAATDTLVTGGVGDRQFTLGALRKDGAPQETFTGVLEEIRVWRTRRSGDQIQDNLFTRLRSARQDLLAYYTCDDDSTLPDSTRLRDEGPRGNHLPLPKDATRPAVVLSTAPVSSDTAQVRGALAGVRTAFHEPIDSAPAVVEYGALSRDSAGGVMKRCYATIKNGTWQLIVGYKVGDLVSEWVGQAQFDPQVMGFVEGAPPVPAENLVNGPLDPEKDDPAGTTKLVFTQADEVVTSVSSSSESSLRSGLELGLTLGGGSDLFLVTAPLGLGTMEPIAHFAAEGHLKFAMECENSWSSESAVSQGSNSAKALTVAVGGYWQRDRLRYAPSNTGFALVQSATADLFALRLAHTGTLVSYRMRPNPDLPRDWNVIPFPINPYYVKQGTLDGCAGFDDKGAKLLDPSYPQAGRTGEYSYYKPREAYALKRRILREQQRVQSAVARGGRAVFERASPLVKEAVASLGPAGQAGGDAGEEASLRRSFVNTYVWTAEGGFFAESTETVDSFVESTAGSYSFSASGTAGFSVDFEVGPVGVLVECDATFGGGFSETMTRSQEATRTFGIEVECDVPGDLQKYDDAGNPVFDASGQPVRAPGRVDGYRWMTFMLGSSANNYDDLFRKVVDPAWLKQSTHPSAVALRQARQSDKRPPCWRILHRVTYVSRVLPKVPAADAPPVERAMQAENIASNWELIKRLSPYVSSATGSYSELAAATKEALALELPGLLPYSDQITRYLALYHGLLAG